MLKHMKCCCLLVVLSLCLVNQSLLGQERTWTDSTGKFRIDATIVRVEDQKVVLKKTDGKEVTVALERLSGSDREFVRQWQETQMQPSKAEAAGDPEATDWQADVKSTATAKRDRGFDYDFDSNDPWPEIVIQVDVLGKAAANAISYGKLNIESFQDGDSNDLKLAEDRFGPDITSGMERVSRRGNEFFSFHPKDGVRIELKLIDKPNDVDRIATLRGQIDVLTGGTVKNITLPDVASHATGDLEFDLFTDLDITCEFTREDGEIKLSFRGDLENLASINFIDKKGKTLEGFDWSEGGGGDMWQYNYSFDKLPNADLVMEFRIDPVTVTLPFEVKNIRVKNDQ